MKLLGKIEDLLSTDLEGINSQSIKEAMKLVADTTLSHLKSKRNQIGELDSANRSKGEAINCEARQFMLQLSCQTQANTMKLKVHMQRVQEATPH